MPLQYSSVRCTEERDFLKAREELNQAYSRFRKNPSNKNMKLVEQAMVKYQGTKNALFSWFDSRHEI